MKFMEEIISYFPTENDYKLLVEGDGLEVPQKLLFYVVVHFHGTERIVFPV